MKTKYIYQIPLLIAISGMVLLGSCKDDEPTGPQDVSGSIIFTDAGDHTFTIDADDVSLNLVVVGAGGGGGGGVIYGSITNSTGGGGGAGAGESVFVSAASISGRVEYSVTIGLGGNGGTAGNGGQNGTMSTIEFNNVVLYESKAGSGGKSNTKGENVGGSAGSGYPTGAKGKDGTNTDNSWSAEAGTGGLGGDNQSGYGAGGEGGIGASLKNKVSTAAGNGLKGGDGYVRIDWNGTR
jgi:hypothetical protein